MTAAITDNAAYLPGIYIDGKWRHGNTVLSTINPSNQQPLEKVGAGDTASVTLAVAAARAALPAWRASTGAQRAIYLNRIAHSVEAQADALAALQSRSNGKPLVESTIDVGDVVATFRYYAQLANELDAATDAAVRLPSDDFSARLRREAVGVVGLIVPWNFPMVTTAWKLAPALAAGCTAVVKPSEVTPLAELALARIIDSCELPPGVFNVVCGTGQAVGVALVSHTDIAKVSFTGSNAVGIQVMQAAAETVKGVSLELGGKSSLVVLDDADMDMALELACGGGFFNAGQMCSATSRVLVAEKLIGEFQRRLVAKAEAIKLGDPFDPSVQMGPLVNAAQYKRVLHYIERGLAEGASLLTGGTRPDDTPLGYFLRPTIFTDTKTDSALWREEIFGPVICLRAFASDDEAIALANDSEFGLVATVVGANLGRANAIANRLEAGLVWINAPQVIFPQAAWGGYKRSSIGRELGPWGLHSFQEIKHIVSAL